MQPIDFAGVAAEVPSPPCLMFMFCSHAINAQAQARCWFITQAHRRWR